MRLSFATVPASLQSVSLGFLGSDVGKRLACLIAGDTHMILTISGSVLVIDLPGKYWDNTHAGSFQQLRTCTLRPPKLSGRGLTCSIVIPT